MNILITGSGQGLGCQMAIMALKRGNKVWATVHSLAHVSERLSEATNTYADKLHILEMDVSSEAGVHKVYEYLEKRNVILDGIINNAAVLLEREKTIENLDLSAMEESFAVNTIGPMRVIQKMLPLVYKGNQPVIINISSEAGTIINAFPTNYPYSMSKTALNMFTERLREYLKSSDVFVYAIHPGWMRTNMGGNDAPANPEDIAIGVLDIMERKKVIYSKIAFIDSTGRPMPL